MGSWGPPIGLIPASHFPIPSLSLPINHLVLKFFSQSRLLGTPTQDMGSTQRLLPEALAQHHWLTRGFYRERVWTQLVQPHGPWVLDPASPSGNTPPKKIPSSWGPWAEKNASWIQAEASALKTWGGSQRYPGPLRASLWLTAPSPHLSPGFWNPHHHSAAGTEKVSPPGINSQVYVNAATNNFQIIFKMCLN